MVDSQDDDAEELVRQVISENPPEEQGLRDEWAEGVGLHRKEDVHMRLRKRSAPEGEKEYARAQVFLDESVEIAPSNESRSGSALLLYISIAAVACAFWLVLLRHKVKKRRIS